MRPYSEKLQEILANLSGSLDLSENAYSAERPVNKVLVVGITSNRGLCGGFNNNVIKRVNQLVHEDFSASEVSVLCLGKKIKDAYKRSDMYYLNDGLAPYEDIFAQLNFSNTAAIGEELMKLYVDKVFDKIVIVYNSFVNAATQDVRTDQFLPLLPTILAEGESSGDYIFEPSKAEIVEELIPKSLKIQLFKSLLDSNAAEHGARMTAMHKATDNADELRKSLKLSYNKARQAAITNEILEIVGGAEALNN
jgi:F-type H+-transporting ATPase subunit gamma